MLMDGYISGSAVVKLLPEILSGVSDFTSYHYKIVQSLLDNFGRDQERQEITMARGCVAEQLVVAVATAGWTERRGSRTARDY